MKKIEIVNQWLTRALSNLSRANTGKVHKDILYEDLCFDCQQAAEKSLKALMVFHDIEIIRTHSLGVLLEELEKKGIEIPDNIKDAVILNDYAVQTRYPGVYEPVTKQEFIKAVQLAAKVYNWAKSKINN